MFYLVCAYLIYGLISSMHYNLTVGKIQPSFIRSTIYGLFCPLLLLFKIAFIIPSFFGLNFSVIIFVKPDSDTPPENKDI